MGYLMPALIEYERTPIGQSNEPFSLIDWIQHRFAALHARSFQGEPVVVPSERGFSLRSGSTAVLPESAFYQHERASSIA
jgi:hypothetical protein